MLQFNDPISGSILNGTTRYYAIEIDANDLNVLIDMIPGDSVWDDVDMSLFLESSPFTNIYPVERNYA